ncbi:MAG: hypothetical protein JWQ38_3203 [Flavipsychrobacter sp.]|nr:hypothetical protein [Flavipsychrobacter sp.]
MVMKQLLLCILLIFSTVLARAAITGPHTLCVGDSIILSDLLAGKPAPWSSSNTSIAPVGSTTGVVHGVTAGTAVISYALNSGGFDFYTVTVNPLPAPITGPSVVCSGMTISLSDATAGGTWSSNSSACAVVGIATGVVTGVGGPCTTVITYTLPTGCKTTRTVSVNPSPHIHTISGGGGYCAGQPCPHIFLDTSDIGINYQLFCGVTSMGASLPGTNSILDFGTVCTACVYTVLATDPLTSCTSTMNGTVTVSVIPGPPAITGPDTVCAGLSVTLADAMPGGTWTSSNTLVATIGPSGSVIAQSMGSATISYNTGGACSATKLIIVISCPCTFLCNGNFDTSLTPLTSSTNQYPQAKVQCWKTNDPSSTIEIWGPSSGFLAANLDQFCEINSTSGWTTIYQDFTAVAGSNVTISFAHRGRFTLPDTMTVYIQQGTLTVPTIPLPPAAAQIGVPDGYGDANLPGWNYYSINHTFTSSGTARLFFYSKSVGGSPDYGGNWLDDVSVTLTIPPITGPDTVCAGSTIAEQDAATCGTWSSSNTTIARIGSSTGVVTGVTAGTTTITFTNCSGCFVTKVITVLPACVITGINHICVGDTTTLSGCTGCGWTSSNVSVVTVGSCTGLMTGISAGTAMITHVSSGGCTSTFSVTVNPLPSSCVVTGGGSYCPGQPCPHVGLGCSTAGIGYDLYRNGVFVATTPGTGAILDFGVYCNPGVYKVIATNATTGCKATMTDSVIVTLNASAPITGDTVLCEGNSTTLSDAIPGGTWSSGNTSVALISSAGVVTALTPGTSVINYTTAAGCISSVTITVNAIPQLTSSLTMPTLNCDTVISYVPLSNIPGTTFSWSRAIVPGILNPAGSGTGNINEAIYIASTTPVLITYVITLNNHGCISTQSVVVIDSPCIPKEPCDQVSARLVKDSGTCCYSIYISNKFDGGDFSAFVIETGHLNIDNVTQGNVWGGITYLSSHAIIFGDTAHNNYIPLDSAGKNGFLLARICLSGVGVDTLKLKWLGHAQPLDTVCRKDLVIYGCGVPVDTNCAGVINQKAVCNNGVVSMQFQVVNKSSFTMRAITFYTTDPNVKATHTFFPIADLAPGATSPVYSVPLIVKNNAKTGCFYFSACDQNTPPGTGGKYPNYCCLDSIKYCFDIPSCNGCDAISITSIKTDPTNCCYKLSMTNNYYAGAIKCLRFNGHAGTQFAILSGWSIQSPVSANEVVMCAPKGTVDTGVSVDFASFCITGTSTPPYIVTIDFLGADGKVICTKELSYDNCTLVKPTCAVITDDSMYCDGKNTKFSFYVKNYSPFTLYQFDLRLSDTTFTLDKYFIDPVPPIPVNGIGGPYVITVDSTMSALNAMGNFCIYLTGHNNIYIPDSVAATQCCTDSMDVACVPVISCVNGGACCCCQFSGLIIPNGITPNSDADNSKFVIGNSAICTNIDMKVYNRWGNVVYRQSHYNNTWAGTNMQGQLLPQDTYYVVLTLATGAQKAFFIDIRY